MDGLQVSGHLSQSEKDQTEQEWVKKRRKEETTKYVFRQEKVDSPAGTNACSLFAY